MSKPLQDYVLLPFVVTQPFRIFVHDSCPGFLSSRVHEKLVDQSRVPVTTEGSGNLLQLPLLLTSSSSQRYIDRIKIDMVVYMRCELVL